MRSVRGFRVSQRNITSGFEIRTSEFASDSRSNLLWYCQFQPGRSANCPLTAFCSRHNVSPPDARSEVANWGGFQTGASQRGSEFELTEIRLKKGESVDRALRRLKKKIDREGTLKEVRNHRHFEKPSERRRRKVKAARFSAMLSARYADL